MDTTKRGAMASVAEMTRMWISLFTQPKQRRIDRIIKMTLKLYNTTKNYQK